MKILNYDLARGAMTVFPGLCKGCGYCIVKCPRQCITWSETLGLYGTPTVTVEGEKCILCQTCAQVCPDCAIEVTYIPRPKRKKKYFD